jgi:hypothetical protein
MKPLVNVDLLFADRKKLVIVAVCFCAAVYADATFLVGMQMKGISGIKSKIAKAHTDIAAVTRDISLMNQAASTKAVAIQGEANIPEILRSISALATLHSVKILQVTPIKSKDTRTMQSQAYLGLTVKLDLTGGYHDVGMLLNELERGEHPLFAADFRISQGDDFMKQRVTLNLKTYVKK